MSLKPYKATIEIVYAASGQVEADLLLSYLRLGATGSLHPSHCVEAIKSEVQELQRVPTGTRLHDFMDKQKEGDS